MPEQLAVNRTWASDAEGYVFTVSYFTPEEERSPEWERARLNSRYMVKSCEEKRMVRRDVRWFDPIAPGEPKCGRVVYSFSCSPEHPELNGSLEYDHEQALLDEPDEPIAPNCGTKDREKLPPPDNFRHKLEGELTNTHARCGDMLPDQTVGRFHLQRVNYMHVRALFTPQYLMRSPFSRPVRPAGHLRAAAMAGGKLHIVLVDRDLPASADNLFLDQVMTADDDGYCVTLILRQGHNVWRRTIKRDSIPAQDRSLEGKRDHSLDPAEYWTPHIDAHTLQHQLALDLGLPLPKGHPE